MQDNDNDQIDEQVDLSASLIEPEETPEEEVLEDDAEDAGPEGDDDPPIEELKKGYLRQADYTRKTQDLADKARFYDQFQELAGSREGLELLEKQIRDYKSQFGGDDPEDEDSGYDDPDIAALKREIRELKAFVPHLQTIAQERSLLQAVQTVKSELGVEATPEQVAEAIRTTGITDPAAAFAKANWKNIGKTAYKMGHEAAASKPKTPSGGPTDTDLDSLTGDQLFARLEFGNEGRRR